MLFDEVYGGKGAAVVLGCHGLAVGSGRADGEEVSAAGRGQENVAGKDVGRLADGSYDVVGDSGFGSCGREVVDVVAGIVEGWTDEICHAGIDNDELLLAPLLDVEHTGEQRAHLCYHGAAEFEVQLLTFTQLQPACEGGEISLEVGDGVCRRCLVVHSQSSSDIDVWCEDAFAVEFQLELVDASAELLEIVHDQQL